MKKKNKRLGKKPFERTGWQGYEYVVKTAFHGVKTRDSNNISIATDKSSNIGAMKIDSFENKIV